jgi:hypothetical protein
MDRVIVMQHSVDMGGGLRWCPTLGIAFQDNQAREVPYDRAYFEKYVGYEGTDVCNAINASRLKMVCATRRPVLDIGIGCGTFLTACQEFGLPVCGGYDVNPVAREWLQVNGLWLNPFIGLPTTPITWSMWDVLEHLRRPHEILDLIRPRDCLLLAVPIYHDLQREVLGSKHYRPDEHFLYFTPPGLMTWLATYGFQAVAMNRDEDAAGREGTACFAFEKL